MSAVGSIDILQLMTYCIPHRDLSVGGASLGRQTLCVGEALALRNENRAVKSAIGWKFHQTSPQDEIDSLTKINHILKKAFDLLTPGFHGDSSN
jgi:hypothetical protein